MQQVEVVWCVACDGIRESLLYCSCVQPQGQRGKTCNMQYVGVNGLLVQTLQLAARAEHSCTRVV